MAPWSRLPKTLNARRSALIGASLTKPLRATKLVDGSTIEGHVPAEAIERLLSERPDAVGLALPGMPVDAPGMGGNATDWESQRVMLIGAGGELSQFEY